MSSGWARVARKELLEVILNVRALFLTLVIPPILVILVGQLRTGSVKFNVLIAGAPSGTSDLLSVLQDLGPFRITSRDQPSQDPLSEIRAGRFDLVANQDGGSESPWSLYTAETDAFRLKALRLAANNLRQVLVILSTGPKPTKDAIETSIRQLDGAWSTYKQNISNETERGLRSSAERTYNAVNAYLSGDSPERNQIGSLIAALADARPSRFFTYYPEVEGQHGLAPEMTSLILCILPFTLGTSCLIKERQAHTLEALLSAPRVSGTSVFIGKATAIVLITSVVFAITSVLLEAVYDLEVKSGVLLFCLLVALATLSCACLGILVSAVIGSYSQALLASAAFFFCASIFSGFLYPIASSDHRGITFGLSLLFPLTFLHPALKAWMYGAGISSVFMTALWPLLIQCCAYVMIAYLAFRAMLARI